MFFNFLVLWLMQILYILLSFSHVINSKWLVSLTYFVVLKSNRELRSSKVTFSLMFPLCIIFLDSAVRYCCWGCCCNVDCWFLFFCFQIFWFRLWFMRWDCCRCCCWHRCAFGWHTRFCWYETVGYFAPIFSWQFIYIFMFLCVFRFVNVSIILAFVSVINLSFCFSI